MKLNKEQQAYCEKLFQLNHLYFLLDGAARSLTLPDDLKEKVIELQHHVSAEHNKLYEEMSES